MEESRTVTDIRSSNAPNAVSAPRLFLAFLRLGLTAFGGPAMVAYIRDMAVKKKQWLSQETFEDGAALCQSIPGATAMQTAAYVGLRASGPLGALASFIGFGLPARRDRGGGGQALLRTGGDREELPSPPPNRPLKKSA